MQIRHLDLDDVITIEQIEQSVLSSWSRPLILSELQQANSIQLVAFNQAKSDILGWCCARLIVPKAELLKITVITQLRRSGVGTSLLKSLTHQCNTLGCNSILLEVREQNLTARSFYKEFGFAEIGRRKKYYNNPLDNGVILQKKW